MIKILFVCHGNICRSPMAEFVFKKMASDGGKADAFTVASAATSNEELGNPVYPPARRMLNKKGIDCSGKTARRITSGDYDAYDLIIGMDRANMRNLLRFYDNDPEGKICNLLDFAGRTGEEVFDPWYTGDFETAYNDVYTGCKALYNQLIGIMNGAEAETVCLKKFRKKKEAEKPAEESSGGITVLDFSGAVCRADLYEELSKKLPWEDWYGKNLDALWDVLTGMPGIGDSYEILTPPEDREISGYVSAMVEIFREAGKTVSEK